ncbi:IAA-alanine resistance protein 1 isoform X2 [Asparagus officinalis]|uniref:IAA-alanine resistance protein 1 isoform X2 n=1 Tax=Asparagus officinalis TaxID=4686 RepID=UPI00098E7101|nr:IAA-alanine resistance protein 1 isoform X2 [Asparagus officinalis]
MTSASIILFSILLFSPLGYGHSPSCGDHHHDRSEIRRRKLPEELAEEVDLELDGFDGHHHRHHHHHHHGDEDDVELSKIGLWVKALGCSLLVSLASLICLVMLPVICLKGKPSKAVVDSLAVFGAGAMLGDAFLHQLPHAFGGHSHSHDHHISTTDDHHGHGHEHGHGGGQSHSHSLQDLSVGLSILSGIVLFLLVEKVVRYVEENSKGEAHGLGHGHHHLHKRQQKLKCEDENHDAPNPVTESKSKGTVGMGAGEKLLDADNSCLHDEKVQEAALRKRVTSNGSDGQNVLPAVDDSDGCPVVKKASSNESSSPPSSSLIFGYLNLFSDGVHNFTDGMALGCAFLLHGSVGGWSRTLFLLAHELPQEGFTAGGFIYIAVAGVLPEMNTEKTTVRSTAVQLTSLVLGMGIALCISLVE